MAFALLCARVEVLLDGIQHGAGEYDDAIVSVGGVIIVVIAVRANELFAPDSTCKCNGWFRVGLF